MKSLAAVLAETYLIHVDKAEYIENLISASVQRETIVIFDPATEQYSYFPGASLSSSLKEWATAPRYGGTGVLASSRKVLYRIYSNVAPLFFDHPFVMGLVIVIPIGLILMCCCNETKSKNDPIRQIRSDRSQMNVLWDEDESDDIEKPEPVEDGEEEEKKEKGEEEIVDEAVEEKDPTLKKDE
eukprot:sb/3471491/